MESQGHVLSVPLSPARFHLLPFTTPCDVSLLCELGEISSLILSELLVSGSAFLGPLPAEVFPSPVKLTELTITRTGPGMTVTFVQLTVATQDKYAMILFLL